MKNMSQHILCVEYRNDQVKEYIGIKIEFSSKRKEKKIMILDARAKF